MHMRGWAHLQHCERFGTALQGHNIARAYDRRLDWRQRGGVPLPQRAECAELERRAAGFVDEAQTAVREKLLRQRSGTQLRLDLVRLDVAWQPHITPCVSAVRCQTSV